MTKTYVDNTNASDPPGGKRHNVSFDAESKLPTEQGDEKATKKQKKSPKEKAAR